VALLAFRPCVDLALHARGIVPRRAPGPDETALRALWFGAEEGVVYNKIEVTITIAQRAIKIISHSQARATVSCDIDTHLGGMAAQEEEKLLCAF
jgi:hypothetical protein